MCNSLIFITFNKVSVSFNIISDQLKSALFISTYYQNEFNKYTVSKSFIEVTINYYDNQ